MGRADRTVYVYALADRGIPARFTAHGRTVHGLTAGRIAAIVERRPDRPAATADALREQHAIVDALASRSAALLPVRFGALLEEAALRAILERREGDIASALDLVRGRRQMTIRVYGQYPRTATSPAPRTGTEFLERRRRLARDRPPGALLIQESLGELAAADRIEAGEGGLLFTLFHLVPAERLELYRERASSLQEKLAPDQVKVTGPFPPFAFTPALF